MSDGGKGDKRRPGDAEAFDSGYERIFGGKKPVRGSFVWDPVTKSMVPKEEYYENLDVSAPMVMGDIQPYKSMVTGEMIQSRSHHRSHLKQHGLVEVGNETKYIMNQKRPAPPPGLKQRIAEIANAKLKRI